MKKILTAVMLVSALGAAQAGDYVCEIYCKTGGGSTERIYVNVSSSSRSDAASYLDSRAHDICRNDGYAKATSSTMSDSQCRSK